MSRKKLRELQRRISQHFYNEARIMRDILKAELTEKEIDELVQFMDKHPYASIANRLTDASDKHGSN